MNTNTDEQEDPEIVQLTIEITKQQKREIDQIWKNKGYTSRDEFIREALRKTSEPHFTSSALREIVEGLEDIEEGKTMKLDETDVDRDDDY